MDLLLVEDDAAYADTLAQELRALEHRVTIATNGVAALEAVARESFDAVILDRMLPQMEGTAVLQRLRESGATLPVLMLSALGRSVEKVEGLEAGADDYVVKPFSPREVVARVTAILRRTEARAPDAGAAAGAIRQGHLSLDLEGWRAEWEGHEVPLTVSEFSILRTLAAMPAKVFGRDAIIDRLHGPGFAITDRTIDSHIRNLRAKFARVGGGDVIETRPGIGYRLGACSGGAGG